MKITLSLLVAILLHLTSTIAVTLEPTVHSFQKDEYGSLTAEDQRKFNELYAYVEEKGYIEVSITVLAHGETRSDDQMERIEQGRRYAQTKRAVLKNLKREVIGEGKDNSPTRSNVYVMVTAAGLLRILNDPRISSFIAYRVGAASFDAAQTTDSIVEGLSQQLTADQIKVRERIIIKDEDGLVELDSVNSVNKLLAQARTYGSIKLRVVFGTEFTTRDARKHAENTKRYEGIRQSIISDLGPRLIKEDRSNTPGLPEITVTVDAIGLQQLISDPRVIYIESVDLSDLTKEELQELLDKAYSADQTLSPSEVVMPAPGRKRTFRKC